MAFVYCNDRWKDGKENNFPGPCEYSLDQESSCEITQNAASRLLKSMKKAREVRKNVDNEGQKSFKEMIDQKNMKEDDNSKFVQLRSNVKKGKLYRNHSVEIKKNQQIFIQQQTELKIMIKNALHNQSNVGARNKWGNMRIKEMLNEHREKQLKKNAVKLYNRQNKTVLIQDNKQKLKEQLKELQTIFTTQRKGCNINFTNISKRKSPANKFLAHNFSQNQLRFSEPSKQDLHIQPSAVYVSDKNSHDPQVYIKYGNSIAPITPTCSIGTSKLNKQKSIPTGIQDDTFDDDSMQYISDATPGPGSYNIQNEVSKISTRIQKFGVTMERFKPERVPATHALIAPIIPQYKISTNARQQDVGFGRSTKDVKNKSNNTHNGAFYEDYASLEYKTIKTLYKNRKDNLCFDSCKQRFPQQQKKKLPIESDDDSEQQEIEQAQQIQQKPTSNFLSKVNRQLEYMTNPTEGVDFAGQNYNCIANKLKKQKEYLEDYDLQPAPFLTNSNRFMYKQVKPEQKKQQLLGIKIEQLKKKKQIKLKTQEKGFTFSKGMKHDLNGAKMDGIPSPDHYEKSPNWIKPSYNIRFN